VPAAPNFRSRATANPSSSPFASPSRSQLVTYAILRSSSILAILSASFAGDGFYKSATAATQTLSVYQPSTFVIWGGNLPIPAGQPANVTVGRDYTFWGAQWAKQVQSGSFQANATFKGYATSASGVTWTSDPGASSGPPSRVASYIGALVATSATKSGNVESGDVAETVVLKVDNPAAYRPNPGSPGSGVLVAVVQ